MAQEASQLSTTPPLPGLTLVQDINKIARTLGTDFAGPTDPAALAWAYATWADTSSGTLKRRNAANSAWVIEGRLLTSHLPIYAPGSVPTSDVGPIYIIGKGPAEWSGSGYVAFPFSDLQWLGTPVGSYITPKVAPPTNDARFRYVLCTAGQTGPGGYNEGVLTSESVTGTAPLIEATATVSLAGSPFHAETIHLINTENRFVGAGTAEAAENDALQAHKHGAMASYSTSGSSDNVAFVSANGPGQTGSFGAVLNTTSFVSATSNWVLTGGPQNDRVAAAARSGNVTQPRTHRLPHYRRIK